MRDELIATIARHIDFDPDKVSVKMDRTASFSTLEIDVTIPVRQSQNLAHARHPLSRGVTGLNPPK